MWKEGLITALLLAMITVVYSCTCKMEHPQEKACRADFVIVVRVRSELRSGMGYKIKVKKQYKVTDKVLFALRKGVLWTSSRNSTCAFNLKHKSTYIIAGRLQGRKPFLNYCDYRSEWKQVTPRQRKGFRLLYYNNCLCAIQDCPSWMYCPKFPMSCNWGTAWEKLDCEGKQSICMLHQDATCQWKHSKKYPSCSKALRRYKSKSRGRSHPRT